MKRHRFELILSLVFLVVTRLGAPLKVLGLLLAGATLATCSKSVPDDSGGARLVRFDGVRGQRYTEIFLIGGNPITKDPDARREPWK